MDGQVERTHPPLQPARGAALRGHRVTRRLPRIALLVACGVLFTTALHAQADREYARAAPYADITWEDETPSVLLGDAWFELTSVDGRGVTEIVEFARETWGGIWQKRFDEDLVEVLTRMGHPPGETVDLGLRDPESGSELARADVPMTAANRSTIMQAKRARAAAVRRPETLSMAELEEDVRVFERLLGDVFAYREANGVDVAAALADLRARLSGGMSVDAFGLELRKVLALFIDGHAGVSGFDVPPGFLPFLIVPVGDRYAALREDRTGFVDPDHPYLAGIDGRPLAEWMAVARPLIARGSPQYVRWEQSGLLRAFQWIRGMAGVAATDSIRVRLTDEAATGFVERPLALSADQPLYGNWPRRGSGVIEGNIGYLRLPAMGERAVEEVREWMPRFGDTEGLVIDVRMNRGGSRDALVELFPWLVGPGEGPRVASVARYRLFEGFGDDHLENRFMYRAEWDGWSDGQRRAIETFRATFEPEWRPPDAEFSVWHYLVLSRGADDPRPPYDRPVVVLSDAKAFSATDIFLGALRGWPRVTIVGEASGGGSARSVSVPLPNSMLVVRMASMASFRPTGELYDGRGVEPDILVRPALEYWVEGGRDVVMEEAIRLIRGR